MPFGKLSFAVSKVSIALCVQSASFDSFDVSRYTVVKPSFPVYLVLIS